MTDLSRGTRARRGARRPGWLLLTVLLVLAIGASSALVFTSRVELLKLAVILALWAAVVAAFVSVIYRRQSDIDQAKVRDLKLVYDLQLDREISARREYELTVETQLRRELTSEIRAQAADEVAGLRAELAALRANLEILFDADLSHRPAIETDRSRVYSDWTRDTETTGRVTASRIDSEDGEDLDANTEESPIIDVRAEPHPADAEWVSPPSYGGAHRRPSEAEQEARRHRVEEPPRAWSPPPPQPSPQPVSQPAPEPQFTWQSTQQERPPAPAPEPPPPPPRPEPSEPEPEPEPEPTGPVAQAPEWQPAPAEGEWIPAGAPGSNWVSPAAPNSSAQSTGENGSAAEYVGRRRAPEPLELIHRLSRWSDSPAQPAGADSPAQPAMQSPPRRTAGPPFSTTRGRRSWAPACATDIGCRIRGTPAPARARASARTAACAAGGAAAPQRRGHRRAVGCRAARQASSHPDRRRPSQAPR